MLIFACEGGEPAGRSILRKAVILISRARGYALDLDMSVKGLFVVPIWGDFRKKAAVSGAAGCFVEGNRTSGATGSGCFLHWSTCGPNKAGRRETATS